MLKFGHCVVAELDIMTSQVNENRTSTPNVQSSKCTSDNGEQSRPIQSFHRLHLHADLGSRSKFPQT